VGIYLILKNPQNIIKRFAIANDKKKAVLKHQTERITNLDVI
jgi:hypothetical protein